MIAALKQSLLRILGLTIKEFLTIINDKGSLQVLIAPILAQCILFGYGTAFDLKHVPWVYYDEAQNYESQNILFDIANTPNFELKKICPSLKCVENCIDSQEALIGIIITKDFKLDHQLNVIADARNTASANTAIGYVQSIVSSYNQKAFGSLGYNVQSHMWFNPNNITRFSIVSAMIVILTFIQVLMLSSLSISRERENGSYDMMLMTPTNPVEMLIGKAMPPLFISMCQGLLAFLICVFYFEIPLHGNVFALFFGIFCFNISVVGLGMMISVFAKNPMQSMIISFLCLMPMVMCSGMLTSVDAMPQWFKIFVYLDPMYYGLNILWRIYLEGLSLIDIWYFFIPLLITMCITMGMCIYLFRRKLE